MDPKVFRLLDNDLNKPLTLKIVTFYILRFRIYIGTDR
jgi:hypothetical protein